ncbi:MAG: WS/DGAT domain-containing protein [Nocardioides sp.]
MKALSGTDPLILGMEVYPSSVILEDTGTNVTMLSNVDRLDFGLHVDPHLVPDPWLIADAIAVALAELFAASGLGEPTPVVAREVSVA